MKVTVELSLYPLDRDYLGGVVAFIDELERRAREPQGGIDELRVNQMSTQLCGELSAIHEAMAAALDKVDQLGLKVSLVAKYLNTELPLGDAVDLDAVRGNRAR